MHNENLLVFFLQRKILDGSLGFAAGVRNFQHGNVVLNACWQHNFTSIAMYYSELVMEDAHL